MLLKINPVRFNFCLPKLIQNKVLIFLPLSYELAGSRCKPFFFSGLGTILVFNILLHQSEVKLSPYWSMNCFYPVNLLFCTSLYCSRYKNTNVIHTCNFLLFLLWNQTHDHQSFDWSTEFEIAAHPHSPSLWEITRFDTEEIFILYLFYGFFKLVLWWFKSWRFFHYWLNRHLAWWQQHLTVKDILTKCFNKENCSPGMWGKF